jgi:hypothetical protein
MLGQLAKTDSPDINETERTPVYDYCGVIEKYTASPNNTTPKSEGSPPSASTDPGITGLAESGIVSNNSPVTTTNLTNPNPMIRKTAPDSSIGAPGDKKGDIASDSSYIYIANADYNGSTAIWVRSAVDQSWV